MITFRVGAQYLAVFALPGSVVSAIVQVRGVEVGGLWIDSEKLTQLITRHVATCTGAPIEEAERKLAVHKPCVFIPYSSISFAVLLLHDEADSLDESLTDSSVENKCRQVDRRGRVRPRHS